MAATILVVEHDPRYAERMKAALSGSSVEFHFAKDGEETLQSVDQLRPSLIILSSVIPRVSTADLIRQIKARPAGASTPIVITVSGYTGRNPKADAMRLGADDIVAKPFSDSVLADKVQQLLMLHGGPKLTSDQIFGDLLGEEKPASAAPKAHPKPSSDVDKLLEQTLSGLRTSTANRKKTEAEAAASAGLKPKTHSGLDRLVEDTLSGLEKSVRSKTSPGKVPTPAQVAPPSAPPVSPSPPLPLSPSRERAGEGERGREGEKLLLSSPLLAPTETYLKEDQESEGRFGQYALVERIARGGMAEVWKAHMRGVEGFEKIVAIKKILPHLSDDADFVNMFIDEAKLAAQLNHNNIVHIYDLGKIGNSYYIAMEYVEGHDLKDILKRAQETDQPMPIELALFVASKIAAALDYAHRKRDFDQKELGIVHRDVSPQNVLISNEGDIKLCDFGIAKAASKVTHTHAGALKGKFHYMSPEQASGKPIDRRSDVFALATVLFEMLTGRRLFGGENEMSVLDQVREARAEPPSKLNEEVTAEIDAVVIKALQREPEARPQSAGDFAREIDTILYTFRPTPTAADLAIYLDRIYTETPVMPAAEPEPLPVAPAPPPVTSPPPRQIAVPAARVEPAVLSAPSPRKRRWALPIAAGLLLAAAAVGTVLVVRKREPAPVATSRVQTTQPAPTPPPATGTVPTPMLAAVTTAPADEIVPVTDTAAEQALIDEEVRRRLTAERARLDQQRAQAIAAQQQAAQRERERASMPARVPAVETTAPPVRVPEPQQSQPVETTTVTLTAATTAPPPTATQEPPPPVTVREGELVEAGTPGLIEPALIEMPKVPYPPIAKMQRVSGTVVVSALVSETGRVLEAKVLRGVAKNVGLNEAALAMVRGATFRPGTLDGVRVRTYKTIIVPFKL